MSSEADDLVKALVYTVEYVGFDILPPIDGWSWYDALKKYRPELLAEMIKTIGETR